MSEEQLKAFWEAIQADTALQQKLQGVTDPDAIVAIAKEAGFSISADELKKAMESVAELSDELLRSAAGGAGVPDRDELWRKSGGMCVFSDGWVDRDELVWMRSTSWFC